MKPSKQNIGNSGEYYLASYLSANNFIVTITLGRAETYDILAVNPKGKTFKISVKSRFLKANRFALNEKCENIQEKDLFYAFVSLNEFKENPNFWIVPSNIVAKCLKSSYKIWKKTPNKENKKHNDTDMRNFCVYNEKYYPNNWELKVKKYYKNIKQLK